MFCLKLKSSPQTCLVWIITLDGQCVSTKRLRFAVHQTEVSPRVSGGCWLDVQAEAGASLSPHNGESEEKH